MQNTYEGYRPEGCFIVRLPRHLSIFFSRSLPLSLSLPHPRHREFSVSPSLSLAFSSPSLSLFCLALF